ncbi:MAG: hypothetical protein LBU70_11075 [Chitinispirillales bacterium]|jgi:hypothetical protein|nr:hypothetical protein [Chitinispirillales bacterium]
MKKKYVFAILSVMFSQLPVYAVGSGIELGSGARAMAFANNHTAVAKDLSAVYWNPAALAFLPVREVQMSFDGMRMYGTSDIWGPGITIPHGAKMSDHRDRLRLSGIGVMSAIPTLQGGLTLAALFDRPYIFDDFTVYTYNYDKNDEIGTFELDGRMYGDLNRLSGAFGVQVAPKIAAGLTLSVVFGTDRQSAIQKDMGRTFIDDEDYIDHFDYYDVEFENRYLGYALTVGVIGHPLDILRIGLKVDIHSNVGYRETWFYKLDPADNRIRSDRGKGRAHSAPSGSLGLGLILPWLTAALDARVTLPYTFILPESIPDDAQAGRFKFGVGIGLEAPIPGAPIVLRAGYSYDDYDLYPMIHKHEGDRIDWMDEENFMGRGFWPETNRHTIAGGIGYFTSGIGFELSYAYQLWGISGSFTASDFRQDYSSHRVMASIIYRY